MKPKALRWWKLLGPNPVDLECYMPNHVTGFGDTSPYSMSDTMKRTCKALEQVLRAIDDSCDGALACGSVIQGWGWCSPVSWSKPTS